MSNTSDDTPKHENKILTSHQRQWKTPIVRRCHYHQTIPSNSSTITRLRRVRRYLFLTQTHQNIRKDQTIPPQHPTLKQITKEDRTIPPQHTKLTNTQEDQTIPPLIQTNVQDSNMNQTIPYSTQIPNTKNKRRFRRISFHSNRTPKAEEDSYESRSTQTHPKTRRKIRRIWTHTKPTQKQKEEENTSKQHNNPSSNSTP